MPNHQHDRDQYESDICPVIESAPKKGRRNSLQATVEILLQKFVPTSHDSNLEYDGVETTEELGKIDENSVEELEQLLRFKTYLIENRIATNTAARELIAQDKAKEILLNEEDITTEPDSTHFLKSAITKLCNALQRKEKAKNELYSSCLYRRTSSKQLLKLKRVQSMEWDNMSVRWKKSSGLLCEIVHGQDSSDSATDEESKASSIDSLDKGAKQNTNQIEADITPSIPMERVSSRFIIDFGEDQESDSENIADGKNLEQTESNEKKQYFIFYDNKGRKWGTPKESQFNEFTNQNRRESLTKTRGQKPLRFSFSYQA